MEDLFKIYVDRLRDGQEIKIEERVSPDFLEIREPDLAFQKNIEVKGVAYLAENELILNLSILAEALVACSICNEKVPIGIKIENFYYAKPLSEIKSSIFNFKDLLRETILLEVPAFAECNQGNCPKRKEIEKFLKLPANESDEEGYQPFADLDWK